MKKLFFLILSISVFSSCRHLSPSEEWLGQIRKDVDKMQQLLKREKELKVKLYNEIVGSGLEKSFQAVLELQNYRDSCLEMEDDAKALDCLNGDLHKQNLLIKKLQTDAQKLESINELKIVTDELYKTVKNTESRLENPPEQIKKINKEDDEAFKGLKIGIKKILREMDEKGGPRAMQITDRITNLHLYEPVSKKQLIGLRMNKGVYEIMEFSSLKRAPSEMKY